MYTHINLCNVYTYQSTQLPRAPLLLSARGGTRVMYTHINLCNVYTFQSEQVPRVYNIITAAFASLAVISVWGDTNHVYTYKCEPTAACHLAVGSCL